jgi:hypothetical protein
LGNLLIGSHYLISQSCEMPVLLLVQTAVLTEFSIRCVAQIDNSAEKQDEEGKNRSFCQRVEVTNQFPAQAALKRIGIVDKRNSRCRSVRFQVTIPFERTHLCLSDSRFSSLNFSLVYHYVLNFHLALLDRKLLIVYASILISLV